MGFSKPLRCSIVSAWFAALAGVIGASPALADVTIGQLAPDSAVSQCNFVTDRLQPTVTSGNSYVVPAIPPATALVISSWSYNVTPGGAATQSITMKIFRKVADPSTYKVVGHDGPRPMTGTGVHTFPIGVPVDPGDVLGQGLPVSANTACLFNAPGDSHLFLPTPGGNLQDGESASFSTTNNARVNISATVAPLNSFSFGHTALNKKKGTATLTVSLPNPGDLIASGSGVKAAGAFSSKAVGPGDAQLVIRAKGRKRRKLNATGKVKLKVAVTCTPTAGDPNTQSVKVKLKKL